MKFDRGWDGLFATTRIWNHVDSSINDSRSRYFWQCHGQSFLWKYHFTGQHKGDPFARQAWFIIVFTKLYGILFTWFGALFSLSLLSVIHSRSRGNAICVQPKLIRIFFNSFSLHFSLCVLNWILHAVLRCALYYSTSFRKRLLQFCVVNIALVVFPGVGLWWN